MKQLKPHPYVIKLLGCVTKSGKYRNALLTPRVPHIARSIGYTWLTFGKSVDRRRKLGLILF